jgi:hypothetical protein
LQNDGQLLGCAGRERAGKVLAQVVVHTCESDL